MGTSGDLTRKLNAFGAMVYMCLRWGIIGEEISLVFRETRAAYDGILGVGNKFNQLRINYMEAEFVNRIVCLSGVIIILV